MILHSITATDLLEETFRRSLAIQNILQFKAESTDILRLENLDCSLGFVEFVLILIDIDWSIGRGHGESRDNRTVRVCIVSPELDGLDHRSVERLVDQRVRGVTVLAQSDDVVRGRLSRQTIDLGEFSVNLQLIVVDFGLCIGDRRIPILLDYLSLQSILRKRKVEEWVGEIVCEADNPMQSRVAILFVSDYLRRISIDELILVEGKCIVQDIAVDCEAREDVGDGRWTRPGEVKGIECLWEISEVHD